MGSGWTSPILIEGKALDDASLIGLLGKATLPSIKIDTPRSGEAWNDRLLRRFARQYWPYWQRKAPGIRPFLTSSSSKP
jgi:hypothetical protein